MKRETFDMATLKKKIAEMEHHEEHGCCESHDYLSDLPLAIRKRVFALEHLHAKRSDIASSFRQELLELERKYLAKYAPLNEERCKIVNGRREPTEEELTGFSESGVEVVEPSGSSAEKSGIPSFWLTVLHGHPSISALITETDAELLAFLTDIRVSYLPDKPGFKLEFDFAPNDYFSNKTLTKEYHLANPDEDDGEYDDFVYDYAVGTEISWKGDKNLCFKTIVRTQRHRTNNSTRTVKREEMQDSFFHFFIPPVIPDEEEEESGDEEAIDELEARLQVDYEIGEILKDQIVPNAVDWFTGRALEYADLDDEEDYFEGEEEYDSEEEEDDDEEEDDEEESDEEHVARHRSKPGHQRAVRPSGATTGNPEECKQQ